MKVVTTKKELISFINDFRKKGKTIGLVPTMGALHEGHLSLVRECKKNTDITVVSIFVNPTQFNDPEDLKRYPRTPEQDISLLNTVDCDLVFLPTVEEIYPEKDIRKFNFGYLENIMEGARRPGHFNGVGQVVSRLFDIVTPDKAFFGMKDFQQIAIIKNMVQQLNYKIDIVSCPIIREASGLALSSRNMLLDEEHKKNAPHIYATLKKARNLVAQMSVDDLKKWITDQIDSNPYLKTEYVEIVDNTTLQIIQNWNEKNDRVVCVAVHAGKIRLIDNIVL
ncbi:pantothenate synthetase [Odoribacter laneus]|jgi:pantoate--beta-alanine ligase|uniref:pantoate--beta-alanine ligase n=1 Tax=Odoribacter laneus TaxID=626933 RepID=UPI001896E86A|nr:pantoate--beta-alanine ligase [Odoribacter laneus]MBS1446577.1 pantoate--beta-alanine ligase [Odoribacter sp.]GKI23477.1 pantothenate synthetase [Odoribacter laneus]GKI25464.1 pantothenate synthetase [Odoribacter laneus]